MAEVEQAGLEVMSGCLLIIFLVISAIVATLVSITKALRRKEDPRSDANEDDLPNAWPPPPKGKDGKQL